MSSERFDIDVSYRDPLMGGDDPFVADLDRPSPSEYTDPPDELPEDCDDPAECTCPPFYRCLRDLEGLAP